MTSYYFDMSSLNSIRTFVADFLQKNKEPIDILINNAGVACAFWRVSCLQKNFHAGLPKRVESADGIELTMATNHFGPFLLTHLLMGAFAIALRALL